METEKLLDEIREANLTYLMLAQAMIRRDRSQALFRLGLSEEVADLIGALSPAQVLRVAASNMLMCRFRFDDEVVWGLLSSHAQAKDRSQAAGVHAAILMAGQAAEALA